MDGVRDVFLRVHEGQRVIFPTNNVEKCGNVICVSASRAEAIRIAVGAASSVQMRLRPRNEATDAFLFRGNADGHGALGLQVESNVRDLSRMPLFTGETTPEALADPVCVLPLPMPEAETCRDWHDRSFATSLELVRKSGLAIFGTPGHGHFALGRVFWCAFLRGGTQGAIYVLDSVRDAGRIARTWLEGVCEKLGSS